MPMSLHKTPSTIDLILTNALLGHSVPEALDIFPSDHNPVYFEINELTNRECSKVNSYNYSEANWSLFRKYITYNLSSNNHNTQLQSTQDIDLMISKLTQLIMNAQKVSIPLIERMGKIFISKLLKKTYS